MPGLDSRYLAELLWWHMLSETWLHLSREDFWGVGKAHFNYFWLYRFFLPNVNSKPGACDFNTVPEQSRRHSVGA